MSISTTIKRCFWLICTIFIANTQSMTSDNIKLIHGDCMEVMAEYPDDYFDLAVVDPPYGIGVSSVTSHQSQTIDKITTYKAKDWDNVKPGRRYFSELQRISKNQIIWGGNYFTDCLPPTKDWLLWDKQQPEGMHFAMGELAWCSFGRGVRIFYRSIAKDQNRVSNNRLAALKYCRIHPTQKPVALYDWIFKNYAEPGQRILDTHLGSASSAIAATRHNFAEFVGVEIDAEYYEAAVKRFETVTAQTRLFV